MTLSYVIFYCIVMASLGWSIIGGKGHWLMKLLFVPAVIWFSIAIGVSTSSMLGWPAKFADMPDKFELRWVMVKNPDKKSGYEGNIFLWVTDNNPSDDYGMFDLYRPDKLQPRGFVLPYDPELHKEVGKALQKLRKGQRLMGDKSDLKALLEGKGEGKGKKGRGKGDGKDGGFKGDDGSPDDGGGLFYKLPPGKLPEKVI